MSIPAVNKDAVITAKFSLLRFLWGKVLGGQNQAVVENRLCQDKLSFTYKIWIHDISSKRISHTLAHLETNSYKIFQISQNFQTILQNILCRNKRQSHFDMFITSILHLNKGYWLLQSTPTFHPFRSHSRTNQRPQDFWVIQEDAFCAVFGFFSENKENLDFEYRGVTLRLKILIFLV